MTNNNPVPTNWNNNGDEHNNSTYMNQQTRIVEQQDRENRSRDINLELPFGPSVGESSETTRSGIHNQSMLSPSHVLSSASFTSAVNDYLSVEDRTAPSMLYPSITPTNSQHYSHQHATYADPMSTFQAQAPIQQYNQQSFLSPFDSSSSWSREDDIPRGSPRRRLSYDETLILSRDRNNTIASGNTTAIGTSPTTIRSSTRRRDALTPSRNRNVSIRRPSSAGPLSRQQHFRRQLQNTSSSTSPSREMISSPITSIDFNALSLLSPSRTTTTSNPIVSTRRRRQSETIITPHDFATSVSLTQQQIVHEAEDNDNAGTSGESNPAIVTTTATTRDEAPLIITNAAVTATPEDTRSLRDYEDELQYLRDQWTSVCIALSSLRNMYLAVAASSPSPTRFVDLPTTTGKSSDPSSSSSLSSNNTQQKQQQFIDFPIPSSVTVTSFVGTTAPLNTATYTASTSASASSSSSSRNIKQPSNSSEKSLKGGRRGKGRRGDNGNEQRQRESPRGLHPDVEHEMLVGYDDAMLQLRQLQLRVETLEIEIRRLRGQPAVVQEENSRSNSSSPNE